SILSRLPISLEQGHQERRSGRKQENKADRTQKEYGVTAVGDNKRPAVIGLCHGNQHKRKNNRRGRDIHLSKHVTDNAENQRNIHRKHRVGGSESANDRDTDDKRRQKR